MWVSEPSSLRTIALKVRVTPIACVAWPSVGSKSSTECEWTESPTIQCYTTKTNMQQGLKDAAINPAPQPVHAMEAQCAAAMGYNTLNDLKNIKSLSQERMMPLLRAG